MPQILQLNRQTDNASNPITWVDLDLRDNDTTEWIEHESGLSAEMARQLLQSDELSRREVFDDGMLICLHSRNIRSEPGENEFTSLIGSSESNIFARRACYDEPRIGRVACLHS